MATHEDLSDVRAKWQEPIRMKKHEKWWLWRGFLSLALDGSTRSRYVESLITWKPEGSDNFVWRYKGLDDEMDAGWFKENEAFPYHKPNIDIYGVPSRTRSQRGWYHVHRPPCQLCSASLSGYNLVPTANIVSHLPAEIIQMIVNGSLSGTNAGNRRLRPTYLMLVCKHWFNVILGANWADTLHGRDDITQLCALVSVPGSYLKRSVTLIAGDMSYRLDGKDDPWLHLLHELHHLLPGLAQTSVYLAGPLGGGLRTIRSIHAHLPRELPRCFSGNMGRLEIKGVSFQRLDHLKRVIGEMPHLQQFMGTGLSWKDPVNQLPLLKLSVYPTVEKSKIPVLVLLSDCSDNMEAVSLSAPPSSNRIYSIPMHAVLRALLSTVGGSARGFLVFCVFIQFYQSYSKVRFVSTECHIRFADSIRGNRSGADIVVMLSLRTDIPDALMAYVIVAFPKQPSTCFALVDWAALDEHLVAHPQIQSIVLCQEYHRSSTLGPRRQWDFQALSDQDQRLITEHMPLSFEARKVSFTRPHYFMAGEVIEKRNSTVDNYDIADE